MGQLVLVDTTSAENEVFGFSRPGRFGYARKTGWSSDTVT